MSDELEQAMDKEDMPCSINFSEIENDPFVVEKYKENDILNPEGGELLGIINSFNFIKNYQGENTIELYVSAYGFRPDGKILNKIMNCQLPMKNLTFFLDGKQSDDLFSGMLEWATWRGIDKFNGLFIRLKYEFDEEGLIVREIIPFDNSCRFISNDEKRNTDVYLKRIIIYEPETKRSIDKTPSYKTKTGDLFEYVCPYTVKVEAVDEDKVNMSGSCHIGDLPPVTKNEINGIIGTNLAGNFDKTVNEWLVVMTLTEDDVPEPVVEQYLFEVYDYKHPEIKDDELYEYHIGCGWRVDEVDNKEYKSPFEKAFALADEHKKGRFGNVCNLFTMYIYNEILKMRKNKQQ